MLRVAIAGTGFIGAVHAHAARAAGAHIVGVAASTPAASRAAAERLGASRAFDTAAELVGSGDVDVVHICTPNHLHESLALEALAAGKHVVCEKPLAIDVDGARRLTEAAEAAPSQVAAVPFVYRYYPTVHEARHRVGAGETGSVNLIHGTYLQDWLLGPEDDNWRVDPGLGGASRAFADIGSHWCDLAEFVSGHRIARLSARTTSAVGSRGTEDAAVMQFETDGGALGSVVVSQISGGRKNRLWLEVDGAREAVAFNQEEPESLWRGDQQQTTLIRRDAATMSAGAARLSTLPPGHPQGYQDCFDAFVSDVYEAARSGESPDGLPLFADGLRAAEITDAVLRSSREQRWVDVAALAPVEVTG